MGRTAFANKDILWNVNKRGEKSALGCIEHLSLGGKRQEKTWYVVPAQHFSENSGGQFVGEKSHFIYGADALKQIRDTQHYNQMNLFSC